MSVIKLRAVWKCICFGLLFETNLSVIYFGNLFVHRFFRSLFIQLFLTWSPLPPPKNQGDDPYFNKLIRILATRCMTQVLKINSFNNLYSISWLRFVRNFSIHASVMCNFRQYTSAVEISALQSLLIMVLLLLCTHISLRP